MMLPKSPATRINGEVRLAKASGEASRTYRIDFSNKRISGFCDGVEALKQAVYKIIQTERFTYPIYSWNYGIELNAVIGRSRKVFESEIERVIREALLADSRITDIVNFSLIRSGKRGIAVSLQINTVFGDISVESEVLTNA